MKHEMTEKEKVMFEALPKPSEGSEFRLSRVVTYSDPHPYCIGPRHVAYAADHCGGMLSESAIEEAEKYGVKCAMKLGRGHGRCGQSYRDHKSMPTAVIVLHNDHPADLNAIPGLHTYLLSIKEKATELGIEGFAFPTEKQEVA